jgi:hypothetical protein
MSAGVKWWGLMYEMMPTIARNQGSGMRDRELVMRNEG